MNQNIVTVYCIKYVFIPQRRCITVLHIIELLYNVRYDALTLALCEREIVEGKGIL